MSRKTGTITKETKSRLLTAATAEFARYGFQKASLRRICAQAAVTTGALYFFFRDKEDLFGHVIAPVTSGILALMEAHYKAELISPEETLTKGEAEDLRTSEELLTLFYAHRTIGDIILNNRDLPAVCSFFDRLTALMDRQTGLLLTQLPPGQVQNPAFNSDTIHWFSHLQIDAVLYIIDHNLGKQEAKEQLKIMVRVLRGGFLSLLPERTIESE